SPDSEIERISGQDTAETVSVREDPQILSSVENASVETPSVETSINDESLNESSDSSEVSVAFDSVGSSIEGIADEPLVIETGDIEAGELITRADTLEPLAAEHHEAEASDLATEDADKTLDVLSDDVFPEATQPEVDTGKKTAVAPREIEPLPYPWSLAVPNQNHTATADVLENADAAFSSENIMPLGDESVNQKQKTLGTLGSQAVQSPVSNPPEVISKAGVVKLLFTLKPGNYHGYIVPDDGTQDILFHQKYINSDVFERLDRGVQVMVRVKHIEGKAYATHVELQ
ncbi:MAG: cold shock domain-containing protein, partial [Cyanobacteria bacterium J06555_13]